MAEPDADAELVAAARKLLEEYEAFEAVQGAAGSALDEAHAKLDAAHRAALRCTPPAGRAELALLPAVIDGLGEAAHQLADVQDAAMHRPASPRTFAWDPTSEREVRDDINHNLRVREQLFDQLWRIHERGSLGRRPAPTSPRALKVGMVAPGFHVCAICDRDHWSIGGLAGIVLADTGASVCWVCGDEHNAALTAEVLAAAVDESEQWIASRFPDYFTRWADLLRRRFGMEQAALDLDKKVARYQEQVRRAKSAGLGLPGTWLSAAE